MHSKAKKGCGGGGICVKKSSSNDFDISIISEEYEGILAVALSHMVSSVVIIIVSSNWGRDCETFFVNL